MIHQMAGRDLFPSLAETLELHPRINPMDAQKEYEEANSVHYYSINDDTAIENYKRYLNTLYEKRGGVRRSSQSKPLGKSAPSATTASERNRIIQELIGATASSGAPIESSTPTRASISPTPSAYEKLAEDTARFCALRLHIGVPTIRWFHRELIENGQQILGSADHARSTIHLWTGIPDSGHLVATAAHECFHLSQPSTGWEFQINRQRREREAYEYGFRIATAWQNNPSLFD